MIEYKLIELPFENRIGLMVRGHAYYAKPGQDDIVCASVSAIAQAAINGCIEFGENTNISSCRPGHFVFTTDTMEQTEAIVRTAFMGIQNIAEQYPACFKI